METEADGPGGWSHWVWLNGRVLSREEARISVFDRGFLHGDGVYETLRVRSGRIFRWLPHQDRLTRSLAAARMSLPFSLEALETAVSHCLEANALREARLRLTVTRGEGSPGIEISSAPSVATVMIAASPWRPLPDEKYRDGVPAIIPRIRQTGRESLDPALKSTSRIHLVLARLEASERGAQEAILLGQDGEVREGTSSNVFVVRGGRLQTVALREGILEGVTREVILELARASGRGCEELRLMQEDLETAEEIFVTNTSWGALPVTRLDGKAVGGGKPGPVTFDLGRRLAELVESECTG